MATNEQTSGSRSSAAGGSATLVGAQIGDFAILREIGRGGMGTVFEARQISLNRTVAFKVLSSGLGLTQSTVMRFQREAQAAAGLRHPSIVPIHAQGESDGVYYYAMELILGRNLHDIIKELRGESCSAPASALAETEPLPRSPDPADTGPRPDGAPPRTERSPSSKAPTDSATTVAVARRAPEFDRIAGLTAEVADALDYAHRQGVIHRDVKPHNLILGDDERVYVLDFGLARVLRQPGVTTTGEFVGSPLYMSPEQISGGRQKIDRRTDVYSLGATLYEWLTLSPPYPGETREEVISKVITSDVRPPREINPQIPIDLETICLQALEKDPNRRFATAGHMRDDLRRFVEHRTIRARRTGLAGRTYRFLRQRVGTVATAAVLAAAVLTVALALQSRTSRDRKKEIATISETTEQLAQEKNDLREDLEAKEEEIAQKDSQIEILQEILANPEAARLIQNMATGSPKADPLAVRMHTVFVEHLRIEEGEHPETPLGPAEVAAQEIYLQALASTDPAQAVDLVGQCLRLKPEHMGAEVLAAALACQAQDFARMSAYANRVVAREPDKPIGHLLLGVAQLLSGGPTAAITAFEESIRRGESSAWAVVLRGVSRARQKEYAAAIQDFDDGLAMSPRNVVALLERGRAYAYLTELGKAIADATRVVQIEPENTEGYILRGDCYEAIEQYRAAHEDYARAVDLGAGTVGVLAKLWQASVKAEQQEAATSAGPPDPPVGVQDAPARPPSSPGAGSARGRFDWLKRLLDDRHEDPPAAAQLGFPAYLGM